MNEERSEGKPSVEKSLKWALSQDYQSVAATHARILAHALKALIEQSAKSDTEPDHGQREGDECRRLAREIFDGLLGGGMCEFDIADKIQALLQSHKAERPSVSREDAIKLFIKHSADGEVDEALISQVPRCLRMLEVFIDTPDLQAHGEEFYRDTWGLVNDLYLRYKQLLQSHQARGEKADGQGEGDREKYYHIIKNCPKCGEPTLQSHKLIESKEG